MGTKQRQKRAGLRRRLAKFRGDDLWALAVAAGASPGVRHRWPTVAHFVSHVVRADRTGGRPAGAAQLERILADCVEDEPSLSWLEDFVPEDPRNVVSVRLGQETVRLAPGSIERPVADIDRAIMVARAVDEFLIPHVGFGVQHVLDVVLKYTDTAITVLEPSWPEGDLGHGAPVILMPDEVDAARRLIAVGTPSAIESTPEHRKALDWLTCDADDLPYEPSHTQSPFGRFVRVRQAAHETPRWLPTAFLPEILGFAVSELAARAAALPGANLRFAQEVAAESRRLLWRFGQVYGPPDETGVAAVSPSNVVQWVSAPAPGRMVLVQVMSRLRLDNLQFEDEPEALRAAGALASGSSPSVEVSMAKGQMRVNAKAEVVPLLVVGSPSHVVAPQGPGLPAMSLDDLRWIAQTAESTSDLFTFCRDMSRSNLPPLFAWEAIDIWEWWRANGKSVFRGGQSPSLISVAPHAGTAEWHRAAELTPLEDALAHLGLPGLRALVGIDHEAKGPPIIYSYRAASSAPQDEPSEPVQSHGALHVPPDLEAWAVHAARTPVAISALRPEWEEEFVDVLHNMSGAFCFALRAVSDSWEAAHADTGIAGHIVELSAQRLGGDAGFVRCASTETVEHIDGSIIRSVFEVDLDGFDEESANITDLLRDAMARAVSETLHASGIGTAAVQTVQEAWRAAPPTLAVQVSRPPTVRNDLALPVELDAALISQVDRRVAEAVRAAGVAPGDYTGHRAKELDRDVLAPAALAQLDTALAAHHMDDLVKYGMEQLERCINRRDRALQDVRQSAAKLKLEWDPAERYQELEAQYLQLRRCCETAIEASLRSAAKGTRQVDAIAWGEVLASAHAYLAATMRSEGIHHQVSPTLLRVSESWELSTERDESGAAAIAAAGGGRVYDFDAQALGRLRAADLISGDQSDDGSASPVRVIPPSGETASNVPQADANPSSTARNVGTTAPEDQGDGPVDAAVDVAMFEAYGASGTNILSALLALAHWPLKEEDPDAVPVTRDMVVNHILDYTTLSDDPDGRRKADAAVTLLTSSSADLSAADWKPWHARSRKRRILVQPLPTLSDERLVVGPHLCLGVLTIYKRYLDQGQLPWSQPQPPAKVERALEELRERRNKALERSVGALLRQDGWLVIENVKEKKAGRLNLPQLQTEIDAVAGKAGHPTIWLLEVKDPADVFVVPEIRRALDTFFVDGKKPAYASQLQRKYDDLEPHAAEVAEALGLPPASPESPYVIKPMFVTRRPVPAAFVSGPFPFASLRHLLETLG
jgi:hypothetical protein